MWIAYIRAGPMVMRRRAVRTIGLVRWRVARANVHADSGGPAAGAGAQGAPGSPVGRLSRRHDPRVAGSEHDRLPLPRVIPGEESGPEGPQKVITLSAQIAQAVSSAIVG